MMFSVKTSLNILKYLGSIDILDILVTANKVLQISQDSRNFCAIPTDIGRSDTKKSQNVSK